MIYYSIEGEINMCQFCSGKTSDERFFLDYSSNEIVFIDNDFDLCIDMASELWLGGENYVPTPSGHVSGRTGMGEK